MPCGDKWEMSFFSQRAYVVIGICEKKDKQMMTSCSGSLRSSGLTVERKLSNPRTFVLNSTAAGCMSQVCTLELGNRNRRCRDSRPYPAAKSRIFLGDQGVSLSPLRSRTISSDLR